MDSRLSTLASNFAQAFYERSWRGALDPSVAEISIAEAYAVQDQVAALRVAGGEEVVGYKVGCTSDAIRRQFGLEEPISGRLFRPHVHQEGTERCWDDYLNCAIEPEMVLTIGADLVGTDLPDAATAPKLNNVVIEGASTCSAASSTQSWVRRSVKVMPSRAPTIADNVRALSPSPSDSTTPCPASPPA